MDLTDVGNHHDPTQLHLSDEDSTSNGSDFNQSEAGSDDMFDMFTGDIAATELPTDDIGFESDDHVQLSNLVREAYDNEEKRTISAASSHSNRIQSGSRSAGTDTVGNTDAHSGPFQYQDLPVGMIRTLEILPAEFEDQVLSVRVRHDHSANYRHYLALSYAWGRKFDDGSHLTHTILCNDRTFKITANLHAALLQIRQHLDSGLWHDFQVRPSLWVDAICINQLNVAERNEQVQIMDQIYQNARRVLVYLGAADGIDCARLESTARLLATEATDTSVQDIGEDLKNVFRRPWFERRWVIQEFALNSRRTVLLGNIAIDWRHFSALLDVYHTTKVNPWLDPPLGGGPMTMAKVFDSSSPRRWLATNVFLFRDSKCSEKKDEIYSLAAISCDCSTARAFTQHGGPSCDSGILIDYELSFDRLLFKLSQKWIRRDFMAVLGLASSGNDINGIESKLRSEGNRQNPSWSLCSVDPFFSGESTAPAYRSLHALWLSVTPYFDSIRPGQLQPLALEGFTMSEDLMHWYIQPDYPPPERRSLCTLHANDMGGIYFADADCTIWHWASKWRYFNQIPAVIQRPRDEDEDVSVLVMSGWLLSQPQNTNTLSEELDWKDHRTTHSWPFMYWSRKPECGCQPDENAFEIIPGDWPELLSGQVVLLVFRYRLALILQETQEGNQYVFIRCVIRPKAVGNLRFAWVQQDTGRVWAFGSIEKPPVEVEIV